MASLFPSHENLKNRSHRRRNTFSGTQNLITCHLDSGKFRKCFRDIEKLEEGEIRNQTPAASFRRT